MAKQPSPLSPKQTRFLELYHQTGNAGQSWSRAGYTASEKTARSAASRFLKRDDARAYLYDLQQKDSENTTLTREKILNRLEQIIDDPEARDRDVIYAIKEANRMLGHYEKPKPPPEEEPYDPIREEILRVINQKQPPVKKSEPGDNWFPKGGYQITEEERARILGRPAKMQRPKTRTVVPPSDPWTARAIEQEAKIAAMKGRTNPPPSAKNYDYLKPAKNPERPDANSSPT